MVELNIDCLRVVVVHLRWSQASALASCNMGKGKFWAGVPEVDDSAGRKPGRCIPASPTTPLTSARRNGHNER